MTAKYETWAVQTIRKSDGAIVATRDGYRDEAAATKSMRHHGHWLNTEEYSNKVVQTQKAHA